MRRLLFGIFSLALLASCDDGEIIVTNFDFEDSTVKFCNGTNKNVFYLINNDDVFESLSLEFKSNVLDLNENGSIIPPEEEEISFDLTGTSSSDNRIVYRIFRSEVPNDYFCNVVPPSEPAVVEEWISGSGATVFIKTGFNDETANVDIDGDGLDNIEEGWVAGGPSTDTDEDGIPDYLDKDDDGDNVPTETELANSDGDPVNEDGYRDTDEDGIPNYLDNDDDDDGVLTRLEVEEGNEDNPTLFQTAEGISNYLNKEQTDSLQHDEYINHDIKRSYGYEITVEDLRFTKQDGSGESIQYQNYNFGNYAQSNVNVPQCPSQDPDCGEPAPETPTEETN